jgi:hypothetical protein
MFRRTLVLTFVGVILCSAVLAQSSDQLFPTPVLTNEINGSIAPRRVGDNRLTRYFYTFNSSQGDLFVNVVTQNFNGDIDIFIAESMQAVGKIVVYSDTSRNETGRLLYFRKPERLLLRIEGRTPNDEPATFRIKFGGSFAASTDSGKDAVEAPTLQRPTTGRVEEKVVEKVAETPSRTTVRPISKTATKADVSTAGSEKIPEPKPIRGRTPPKRQSSVTVAKEPVNPVSQTSSSKDGFEKKTSPGNAAPAPAVLFGAKKTEPAPDPLSGVIMRIELRDGKVVENRMSDVLSFGFDRGQLSVRLKDGKVFRYALLDVAKFSIE